MLTADSMFAQVTDPGQRQQLELRALTLLVAGMRTTLITAMIGPALIAWLSAPYIGLIPALVPAAVLYCISVERFIVVRRASRQLQRKTVDTRQWLRAFTWRTGLSAFVVASWGYPIVGTENNTLIFMILALATIVSASSMAQFCCWPPAMWASFTPILLGLGLQLFIFGGGDQLFGAVFTCLLWVTLVMAGLRFARTLHNDMTTRLLNENLMRELDEKRAQAEAANEAKSRFFAAASHDLRQPLQAMGLYLSVLEGGRNDPTTLARLNECMTSLDGLLEVVMDLSRLESGQITPHPRAFALQPLLSRLAWMYEGSARQKGLQLRVHPTSAWALSDATLLERVLSNLIANAIRYTTRGGVLLAVRRCKAGVRVCVIDTGIGIPESAHQSVFEEFVQLNNPERDPTRGSGLGLSTVRRVTALLGHPLSLRSAVGRGTAFTIELPRAKPELEALHPLASSADPVRLVGTVLLVEDNAAVRDALLQLLAKWGLSATAVRNGEEASVAMASAGFDVVLSDWRLPGDQDGLAVLHEARARLPHLRLGLLITGEDVQMLPKAGQEFLVLRKPVRPLRLRALLQAHLR
ncbi:MAG: hybrid sensor histidine kinase/response regulator [Gammaproteobacteria bacterium]|jgi:signal transduction histidine kinase|nr:hybrid sensor histidine kinase/response regulator [Gammaproteobacteria bacterium]MBU1352159.1 hybrid sensor histidine kinase/response regulator [Gammaproteobacteria bacterium]MBU1505841.1 hybrid sensor histidine kinase/response regulator [Gammaproteobacteria bacterium]MBU1816788.1 hybrid sensor histidine kinase/response regulator [Gammaproteobacteria bacterium]MBU2119529.1 hybrid sensor histidine kinase/response regulator [Gammaproteobacteria bacterium]